MALFRIIAWLKRNSDADMFFLFKESGPLQQDVLNYGTIVSWDANEKVSFFDRFLRVLTKRKTPHQRLIERVQKEGFDLIYYNTIAVSDLIRAMAVLQVKKLWHLHELELAAKTIGIGNLKAVSHIDYVVANSESTKSFLLDYGVDENLISVFYPTINVREIVSRSQERSNALDSFPIENEFVIGSAGTVLERKGVQAFIILAKTIDRIFPENNFKYVWVGALNGRDRIIIEHDIQKASLSEKVYFTGELSNPYPVYNSFSVFVSTSKEESFGLALIEAACLGKALFCFKNSHEVERVVRSASNFVSDYLDVLSMSEQLVELFRNEDRLVEAGGRAYNTAKMYDEDEIMPPFLNFLKEIC